MNNDIQSRQNEARQIDNLAAQRQLYREAKKIQLLQIALTVPPSLIWPALVAIVPGIAIYAAIWGIVIAVLDASVLSPFIQNRRKAAAGIQELFDCYVLALDWHELHSGHEPSREAILLAARRFDLQHGDRKLLESWYAPSVSKLPISLGRIVCQRSSCWWDGELRRRFSQGILAFACVVVVFSALIGVAAKFSVAQYVLAVAVPLLPLLILCIKQYIENRAAATTVDKLRDHADSVWKSARSGKLDDTALMAQSRDLQCEIFSHRKSAPAIFDWVYGRLRNVHEETMNRTTDDLVDEVILSVGGRLPANMSPQQVPESQNI